MDKQHEGLNVKVDYVKPAILDLGPVTVAYGAASCLPNGPSATGSCNYGDHAGGCAIAGDFPGSTSY